MLEIHLKGLTIVEGKKLLHDVTHFYFIKEFGQSPFVDYDPQPILEDLIPEMEPSEFAKYISDLLKGLIK